MHRNYDHMTTNFVSFDFFAQDQKVAKKGKRRTKDAENITVEFLNQNPDN